jgi:hypothetical protein
VHVTSANKSLNKSKSKNKFQSSSATYEMELPDINAIDDELNKENKESYKVN